MSCISQFSKYIIFIFNFIIAICAVVLIVFGIIYIINESDGVNVFGDVFSLGALAISVGVIIFFIAALGCCGALHENSCLLTTYAIILIVLFVIQLVLGILAVVKIKDEDDFFNQVKDLVRDLFDNKDKASIAAFYALQSSFHCCGVNGPSDYSVTTEGYPKSCCENETTPCFHPYNAGCAAAFTDTIRDYIEIIGYVSIGFAVVEVSYIKHLICVTKTHLL
jgi:CD63 antigen